MFPTNDELFNLMILKGVTGGAVIEATATGNPLTFITDKAKPLKSLLIPFTPQQEGTGDPSPENIRSILPWNGLKVWNGGQNLLDENGTIYNRTIGGEYWTASSTAKTLAFKGKQNTQYDVSIFNDESTIFRMCTIDKDPSEVTEERYPITNYKSPIRSSGHATITTDDENIWIIVQASGAYITDRNAKLMIVAGSKKPSSYEPYHPITETDIVFPSAVYGGALDAVSGVLTVEWETKQFDGSSDEVWYFVRVGTSDYYRAYINIPDAKQPNNVAVFADSYKAVSFDNRSFSSKVCFMGNENETPVIFALITDLTTPESFKAYLAENPLTIVYKLATPQEIQLTPAQITALLGQNTIWSDADGSMTAVYLKKK